MKNRPLQPEDLWHIPRVGKPCPSPDGARLVVPVTTSDIEENKTITRLWLHGPGERPRALTAKGASASSPAWSPDGSRLAFVRKVEEKKPQIFVLPLDGGEAEAVTDCEEGAVDPRWAPDGSRIFFAQRVSIHDRDERAFVSEDRVPRYWDHWLTDGLRWHIASVDLASGKVRDHTPRLKAFLSWEDPNGSWDLSPDGKEIAYAALRSTAKSKPRWGVFRLRLGGKPTVIDAPGWNAWSPR